MPMPSATSVVGRAIAATGSSAWRPSLGANAVQAASAAETNISAAALRIGHGSQSFVRGSAQRQPHAEVRAGLAVSHELDRAAVRLHALGNDGQPDARSADGAALRPPALIKGLEDPVAIFWMHARPVVADVHDEIGGVHSRADVDGASGRSELEGVGQQVLEHEL